MQIDEDQLKRFILDGGLITKPALDAVVKEAKEKKQKFSDLLLAEGKISEADLKRMEAFVLGIPFINLANEKIDVSVLTLISEPIARNYNIIAYKKSASPTSR